MDGDVFSILPLTFLCAVYLELPLDGDVFSILPLTFLCAVYLELPLDGDVFSILPLTFLCAVCLELPLDGDLFSLSSITYSIHPPTECALCVCFLRMRISLSSITYFILPLNVPCAICFVELSLEEEFPCLPSPAPSSH